MSLSLLGEITDGVLFLHPVFTIGQFNGQPLTPISFPAPQLTIDGSRVSQCDSVGIAALVWLLRCARREQIALRWQNLPPVVTHLRDLYELDFAGMSQLCRKN